MVIFWEGKGEGEMGDAAFGGFEESGESSFGATPVEKLSF